MPHVALALALAGALELPPDAGRVLADGEFRATPAGFRVIALSHLADGCAAQVVDDPAGARGCVEQAFARALLTRPKGARFDDGRHGLWLSHLALILGAGDATGRCLDEALHRQVAHGLARASLDDPTGLAPSYPRNRERWPADQAATLAALARFDRAHEGSLAAAPLARYRAALEGAHDDDTGLPWSELHGLGTGKLPRGCALAYSIRYLSEVDLELARAWWAPFRASYLVDRYLLVGFREWPPGVERAADVDSGPIVGGVGAAATAFGIAAARAMGDRALAARLEATAGVVGFAAGLDATAKHAAESTLAAAIRFQAAHQHAR